MAWGHFATYVYNALGQRIKQNAGAPGTVLNMYDEAGNLVGEYNGTGVLIQETVWEENLPVATLRPSGMSVAIYYAHTDHLKSSIRVSRPSDNKLMWTWYASPFGTDTPNENLASGGTFLVATVAAHTPTQGHGHSMSCGLLSAAGMCVRTILGLPARSLLVTIVFTVGCTWGDGSSVPDQLGMEFVSMSGAEIVARLENGLDQPIHINGYRTHSRAIQVFGNNAQIECVTSPGHSESELFGLSDGPQPKFRVPDPN